MRTTQGKVNCTVIRGFLLFAILMLGFEIVAYMKGWNFSCPHFDFSPALDLQGVLHPIYSEWVFVGATYLAPPLQAFANICIVLFLIQSADTLVLAMGCLWIHIKKIKPVPQFEFLSSAADLEKGASAEYPMVLVQIPMCNEMEDILNGFEFARGPSNSTWGYVRAAMGHPDPFNLKYVAIGNEDCGKQFENGHIS